MKFLKGFGLAILGFLLFLSLSVFGLAFMLKSTLLSPDFVVREVDKVDMPALAGALIKPEINGTTSAESNLIAEALPRVVADLEPQLKEQLDGAIYAGYEYLLGKSARLNIVFSLGALKTSLKDSLWRVLDGYISSDLSALPPDLLKPYLEEHYQEFVALLPADYLPPGASGLSGDQLKMYLEGHYQDFIRQIPEAQLKPLADQLKTQLRPYYDQYYQELASQLPDTYTADESSVPPEAMRVVTQVRQFIGYFQTGYYILIGFMVLLIGLIILINRSVRGSTRSLGIDFLLYGVLELAGVLVARHFLPTLPLPSDFPPSLQTWLLGLLGDLLVPLQMFSIGLVVGGVVLIIVSFVARPREAEV